MSKVETKLTQKEADYLLNMVKKALIESFAFPEPGQTFSFDLEGEHRKDVFTVSIFSSLRVRDKVNYGARIKANGIMLLELHINPTSKHVNPDDGTVITGSHWHLYKEGYGTSIAFPADDVSDEDFVEDTIRFLKTFHVIEMPEVTQQFHL